MSEDRKQLPALPELATDDIDFSEDSFLVRDDSSGSDMRTRLRSAAALDNEGGVDAIRSAAGRDVGTEPDNMPDIEVADARYARLAGGAAANFEEPPQVAGEGMDDRYVPVSAFGGPTAAQVGRGAIVESGETPEGSCVRWEDGVQVCWAT